MIKHLFTKPTGFLAQMLVPVFEKQSFKSQHQRRQKNGVSTDVLHPAEHSKWQACLNHLLR